MDNPKYLVLICLDEASNSYKDMNNRVAGNTAVPLAAEIISRVAPILGVRPEKNYVSYLENFEMDAISDQIDLYSSI